MAVANTLVVAVVVSAVVVNLLKKQIYSELSERIIMKKFLALISVAVLALSFAFTAHAANAISTQELIKDCKGKDGTFITCEIYGQAVYDTYLVTRNPKTAPDFICVQQPAPTRKEVIQEYVQWSDANPKYANDPAADTILRFLAGRFPCNKK